MRILRQLPPYLWMAIWTVLSHRPGGAGIPLDVFPGADKIVHAAAGAVLMACFAVARAGRGRPWLRRAVLISACFAVIDELHQGTVPGRTMDPLDLLADWAGIALAAGVILAWRRSRPRPAGQVGPAE